MAVRGEDRQVLHPGVELPRDPSRLRLYGKQAIRIERHEVLLLRLDFRLSLPSTPGKGDGRRPMAEAILLPTIFQWTRRVQRLACGGAARIERRGGGEQRNCGRRIGRAGRS